MARKLARTVTVRDDDGVARTLAAGSDAPAWAEKRITNPKVWGDTDESKSTRRRSASDEK